MDRNVKKYRVLVLMGEGFEPPETREGLSDEEYFNADWKCEFDVIAALEELGHEEEAARIDNALVEVFAEGKRLTADLGGNATTSEFTQAVIQRL